jgi:hypothetical protein
VFASASGVMPRWTERQALGPMIEWRPTGGDRDATHSEVSQTSRLIVFTGHMIDAPDRARPRFAPSSEQVVRSAIRAWLLDQKRRAGGRLEGIAGGAAGGDILFHEVCAEREVDIPTRLLLALPPGDYAAAAVQYAGAGWA